MLELSNNRILIVGPSWIGDMVMTQSLLKQLVLSNHNIEITVLAPPWCRALLERMPEVDHSIEMPFAHGELRILKRREFARDLRDKFECAIILPNSFKSALIPFFASIPTRIGWRGEYRNMLLTDCRRLDPKAYPLMVERFVALAMKAGVKLDSGLPRPVLKIDNNQVQLTAALFALQPEPKILAMCPGAEFGDAKQWPAEHFASLCEIAVKAGWQVWIIGSDKDQKIAGEIKGKLDSRTKKASKDLTGRTDLSQAIDLLSWATAVVSNDSGLMHVAAALGKPLVALYGSTSPDFTPPLADKVKSLSTEIECRPCFERTCPLGHKRCLTEITPGQVYYELNGLLAT